MTKRVHAHSPVPQAWAVLMSPVLLIPHLKGDWGESWGLQLTEPPGETDSAFTDEDAVAGQRSGS